MWYVDQREYRDKSDIAFGLGYLMLKSTKVVIVNVVYQKRKVGHEKLDILGVC